MELLKVENVTKKYITKKALENMNMTIEEGKIYGLLGPNGSGKTTLMKMIAGLIQPSSGKIEIMEKKIGKESKQMVSYMPTSNHLPKWMKIEQCIGYYDDYFEDFDREKAKELIDFMGLKENLKVGALSTGMLGRLKLSLVLSRNAKLYVLDEPLNGIDPISREKIMQTILNACQEENTVIISSHLVKELETILDEVIFLEKGNVVLSGNAENFRIEKGMSMDELYREVYKDA
ncbi:ABC transporter ATP-binding protein [Marinisporobacter balticus]|uniref:ABC-2 type transport system ATP-binding protein n=1 Tax=Marinisporobacter balticus TaxID=2018667 RepID=A0A4R2KQ05_9FIRM|nr:ABC transporter ATP-binding protein [Marinisporobacter balticus]TCO74782.1 ABC-2 type transport system ATP-binding protein [Marinisporobacter balticus]